MPFRATAASFSKFILGRVFCLRQTKPKRQTVKYTSKKQVFSCGCLKTTPHIYQYGNFKLKNHYNGNVYLTSDDEFRYDKEYISSLKSASLKATASEIKTIVDLAINHSNKDTMSNIGGPISEAWIQSSGITKFSVAKKYNYCIAKELVEDFKKVKIIMHYKSKTDSLNINKHFGSK